ncbi:hypothetical protein Pan44_49460 [Caulifigura coniformis]|uniref:Zinc-finger domain-containing protein n=1 Tax=Caulifigura coniformis TaxID=2527983 RepID=A0A517SL79_9PLAN|nr:zf-HC2 domain-containing protein [Caulifigura coniformis]QDT56885.1 hypothetical protein Pan44_49460 [Caulifigura coniformis]
MKCHEAQRELALHAGEDLGDAQREAEIQAHLAQCPSCRRRHVGVKSALSALAVADAPGTYESVHSLWPALRRRIAQGDHVVSAGWSWQTAAPVIAGLVVCGGLMLSTASLLMRPVVSEPTVTEPPQPVPRSYEVYAPDNRGMRSEPASMKTGPDDAARRGAFTRRLQLPME